MDRQERHLFTDWWPTTRWRRRSLTVPSRSRESRTVSWTEENPETILQAAQVKSLVEGLEIITEPDIQEFDTRNHEPIRR